MTLIQELIKHFVLGIVSLIICSISMAEINIAEIDTLEKKSKKDLKLLCFKEEFFIYLL